MEALFAHVWQSTLFALAAAIAALALRRHAANVRHAVWFVASVKLLLPFAGLVAVGAVFAWREAPLVPEAFVTVVVSPISHLPQGTPPEPVVHGDSFVVAMMIVWAIGALTCIGLWALQCWRLARVTQAGTLLDRGREATIVGRVAKAAGRSPLPVVACDTPLEPGVFGVRRPVLIWPRALSERLSDAQIEAIAAHELAHVARHDNLSALVHCFVQALFWFHPLVWWLGRRLMIERERACDEMVILAGHEPVTYAKSILETSAWCLQAPSCAAGVTGAALKQRIEWIMTASGATALRRWHRVALGGGLLAALAVPVGVGVLSVRPARAQTAESQKAYASASVKANTSGAPNSRVAIQPGGRFRATNATLRTLVRNAFEVQEFQLIGGPDWLNVDHFDIEAVPPEGIDWMRDSKSMLQSLLAERFKLAAHQEARDLPIYALVLSRRDGRLGPRLKRATADCAQTTSRNSAPAASAPGERPGCGLRSGLGSAIGGGVSMPQLARNLSPFVQRIIIDRTGLAGGYDLDLTWTPDQMPPPAPGTGSDQPIRFNGVDINPNGPSIFTALQEQLGLRLEATRGPVEVFVIDKAEHPDVD